MKQEMIGWQWYQLDHVQIICISLQTDNHARASQLSFYRPDALPAAQPTASNYCRHDEHMGRVAENRCGGLALSLAPFTLAIELR